MLYICTNVLELKVENTIRLNYIFTIKALYIIGLGKNIHNEQHSLRCTDTHICNNIYITLIIKFQKNQII